MIKNIQKKKFKIKIKWLFYENCETKISEIFWKEKVFKR